MVEIGGGDAGKGCDFEDTGCDAKDSCVTGLGETG